jgi:hypothetical protein
MLNILLKLPSIKLMKIHLAVLDLLHANSHVKKTNTGIVLKFWSQMLQKE